MASLLFSAEYVTGVICEICVFVLISVKVTFDPQLLPPSHMPIVYGPVKSRKTKAEMSQKDTADDVDICHVCTICNSRLLVCSLVLQLPLSVVICIWNDGLHLSICQLHK